MNVLFCTYFDLTKHSAGLNRIYNLRDSLIKFKINLIVVGSGLENCLNMSWKITKLNNHKVVLYDKKKFYSFGISNFGRDFNTANNFYKKSFNNLNKKLNLSGMIVYSPFYSIVKTLSKYQSKKLFLIVDCGELFDFSIHNLLNGVNFQQFLFIKFIMSKLSGIIAQSPMWVKKAKYFGISRLYLPCVINKNFIYRKKESKLNSKINIIFIGKLNDRELPSIIFKSLHLCLKKKLSFEFKILGNQDSKKARYWKNTLSRNKELNERTSILGFISENEKYKHLAKADIFIMLRQNNNETKHLFPSRIPELLSCANPVIITKTPSLDFFFKENHGVRFISQDNSPEEISKAIMELAKDPKKRFKIGQKGRIYSNKFFSYQKVGKKLFNYLSNLNSL